MVKLKTLNDGLIDELRDLYSAETQLIKALPKMEKKAVNSTLKDAIRSHLVETEEQLERLVEIGIILQEKLTGKNCKAMQGLIEEVKEVLETDSQNEAVIDALLIGAAQRVEHYEMAGYGIACSMAKALEEDEVLMLLEQTLEEEIAADQTLTRIAEDEVLVSATKTYAVNFDNDLEEAETSKKIVPHRSKKSGSVGRTVT